MINTVTVKELPKTSFTQKDVEALKKRGLQVSDIRASPPAIKSKYGSTKCEVDGLKFDSKKEAAVYGVLKFAEAQGLISDLKLQVKFELNPGGTFSFKYIADFTYIENGKLVVEDVKPFDKKKNEFYLTPTYKKKKKLMKKVHGIEIKES